MVVKESQREREREREYVRAFTAASLYELFLKFKALRDGCQKT